MQNENTSTTSEARINANRENAKKSSGPRTPEGKNASSRNAIKHGFRGNQPFLPEEDPEPYYATVRDNFAAFQPVGQGEEELVLRISALQFRLSRSFPMENGILRDRINHTSTAADQVCSRNTKAIEAAIEGVTDDHLPAPPLPDQLEGDQLGRAWMADCRYTKSLSLLARYETSAERSLDRCLNLLKHFQAVRRAAARQSATEPQPPATEPQPPAAEPQPPATEPLPEGAVTTFPSNNLPNEPNHTEPVAESTLPALLPTLLLLLQVMIRPLASLASLREIISGPTFDPTRSPHTQPPENPGWIRFPLRASFGFSGPALSLRSRRAVSIRG